MSSLSFQKPTTNLKRRLLLPSDRTISKEFYSPAKLNLFFRVIGKRTDGYHEIASLYQAINLYDTLIFNEASSDELTCSNPYLPCDNRNLVIRALQLFRDRFPFSKGLKIHLEKQIPIQAGLGGGSSNAATTLWALNEFSGRLASLEQLIEMGSLLGSDVPFFFSLGTAYCTGRGEIFEPFELSTPLKGYVAKPPFGLSTSLIYKETEIEQLPQRDPRKDLTAYPIFYNDLEWAAFRVEKRLFAFRKELKAIGFNTVAMTGSGSAFFCMGEPFFDQDKSFPLIPFASVSRHADGWYGVSSI